MLTNCWQHRPGAYYAAHELSCEDQPARARSLRDGVDRDPGLDDVLAGGLPCNRLFLVQGTPGVGKTTLALQFLIEGARRGERCLYISLSETENEIRQVVASHGWSLEGVDLYELSSAEQTLRLDEENTLYATADIELKETVRVLLDEVERVKPTRVVFDSMSEIRLLAGTAVRYRRQLLGLKQYFAGQKSTVLLLDDRSAEVGDTQVESIAHGVIALEQVPVSYGADRRRLRVTKLRGVSYRSGHHDFTVRHGGLVVFPRLVAAEHTEYRVLESLSSGIESLDTLLGGGIDRGTATLIMGPAGTGKSILASQIAYAAAQRGECAAMFLFEERISTLRRRSEALGMRFDKLMQNKAIRVSQVDPAQLAPDEFTQLVRDAVEQHNARVVVIDSINGFLAAMPESRFLMLQLHELLSYLSERGVATVVTIAQSGGFTNNMAAPIDVSYLADSILLLRYFELQGRVRKAVSMLKKRSGAHEDSIRELILKGGVAVGDPLVNFRGVLSGGPVTVNGVADHANVSS